MTPRTPSVVNIEAVVRDTLGVLRRNAISLAVMALVVVGVPSLILRGAVLDNDVLEPGLWTSFGLSGAVLTVAQALLHVLAIRIIWRDLAGRPGLPLGAAVHEAMDGTGRMLLLALVIGLAKGIWYVLMIPGFAVILPGLLLLGLGIWIGVLWCLALPAMVVENLGAIAALNRSTALTHGDRWQLLGVLVILLAITVLAGSILEAALGSPGEAVGQALGGATGSVALTVVYFQLVQAKENRSATQLATEAKLT